MGFGALMVYCVPCRFYFFGSVMYYFATAVVIIIPILSISKLDLIGPVFTYRPWVIFLALIGVLYANSGSPNLLGLLQDLFVGLPVREKMKAVFFGLSTFAGFSLLFFYAFPLLRNVKMPKIKVENSTLKASDPDKAKVKTKEKTLAKTARTKKIETKKIETKIETLVVESKLTISNFLIWMFVYLLFMNVMTAFVNRLFSRHL